MATDETKFSVLCSLFNWMQKSKTSTLKRSKFRKFLDNFCKPADYFSSIRLILPSLDRERGSYGLKESVLATCLIDALGIARDSEDALRLINWRKGGAKTGANAGNFSLVAAEVTVFRFILKLHFFLCVEFLWVLFVSFHFGILAPGSVEFCVSCIWGLARYFFI